MFAILHKSTRFKEETTLLITEAPAFHNKKLTKAHDCLLQIGSQGLLRFLEANRLRVVGEAPRSNLEVMSDCKFVWDLVTRLGAGGTLVILNRLSCFCIPRSSFGPMGLSEMLHFLFFL